jgi:hypothetical protein
VGAVPMSNQCIGSLKGTTEDPWWFTLSGVLAFGDSVGGGCSRTANCPPTRKARYGKSVLPLAREVWSVLLSLPRPIEFTKQAPRGKTAKAIWTGVTFPPRPPRATKKRA